MKVRSSFNCPVCNGSYKLNHKFELSSLCPTHQGLFKAKDIFNKDDFSGFSPAPFVGRYGYPNINVGILSTPDINLDKSAADNPRLWAKDDYNIQSLVDIRSSLLNSRFTANVTDARKSRGFLDISQEISIAAKPVDVEVKLDQKPKFRITTSSYAAPQGPNAKLEKVEITSNPKVNRKVEKAVYDTDLKAQNAIVDLYSRGVDENALTRVLSVGNLGLKKNRKLVPTRWSITAVDDTVSKEMMDKVHYYPEYDYAAYFGGYLGNYYLILFFPDVWSYELFETTDKSAAFMTDNEGYEGRKTYAQNCAGGYYATRLGILEKLNSIRRHAATLAIRIMTDEYTVPLGVWVVREATRKALSSKPLLFGDQNLMLKYAANFAKKKFGKDITYILNRSILLKTMRTQTKLTAF